MQSPAADWQPLFDGHTSAGWTQCRGGAFPAWAWKVEDGCLRTIPGTYLQPDIATAGTFDDFELELEWRVAPGGNSGVFYSLAPQPRFLHEYYTAVAVLVGLPLVAILLLRRKAKALLVLAILLGCGALAAGRLVWAKASGFEMQVLDDVRHADGRDPTRSAGALYGIYAPADKQLRPVGEFNHVRILVRGPHVEHWLNGRKVLEFEIGSPDFRQRLLRGPLADIGGIGVKRATPIALQHHGDAVWFRNIRVKCTGS